MAKHFTSSRPFGSFQVVGEWDGKVAFRGGGPSRALRSGSLGAVDTVWIGDFSRLATAGRYRVEADDGLRSLPFEVGPASSTGRPGGAASVLLPARLHRHRPRALAEGPCASRGDAHLAPPGVVGGWHDAGDFSLYSASLNSALFWTARGRGRLRADGRRHQHPRVGKRRARPARRGALGARVAPLGAGRPGGFANTTCAGPLRSLRDEHRPDRMPPYRTGEVGTLATARAVGTLAYAAAVFRPSDPAFAETGAWRWPGAGTPTSRRTRGEATRTARPAPAFRHDGERAGRPRDVRHVRSGRDAARHRRGPIPRGLRGLGSPATRPDYHHVAASLRLPARRGRSAGPPGRHPGAAPGPRGPGPRRGRRSPVPVDLPLHLGLDRRGLPPDRGVQRQGLPGGSGRRGRPTATRPWPTSTTRWAGTLSSSAT